MLQDRCSESCVTFMYKEMEFTVHKGWMQKDLMKGFLLRSLVFSATRLGRNSFSEEKSQHFNEDHVWSLTNDFVFQLQTGELNKCA